jgi:hypothetical protein
MDVVHAHAVLLQEALQVLPAACLRNGTGELLACTQLVTAATAALIARFVAALLFAAGAGSLSAAVAGRCSCLVLLGTSLALRLLLGVDWWLRDSSGRLVRACAVTATAAVPHANAIATADTLGIGCAAATSWSQACSGT